MRHKKIKFCTLLILGFGLSGLQAQTELKVIEKTGIESSFTLSGIRKISFSSGNLSVSPKEGTIHNYLLNNLSSLTFRGMVNSIYQINSHENAGLSLYPNPANDEIIITCRLIYKSSVQVDIVNLQGIVVLTEKVDLTESKNQFKINIANLSKGLYVCRLVTGLTIENGKFLKN